MMGTRYRYRQGICAGFFYVPVDSMCELRYDGRVSLKKRL